ncbi:putative WD domain, G-beta repeat [Leishmania naiffi]|uniref:WD domain, G-beta repeat n=1 Tax=Leishmania naiffi TaxID=5678 RepID=A0AAW3BWB9_9TRYP
MGCLLSNTVVGRPTSSSIPSPPKANFHNSLLGGPGAMPGSRTGGSREPCGPLITANGPFFCSNPGGSVGMGKCDWASSSEEGRRRGAENRTTPPLLRISPQGMQVTPTLNVADAPNPFTPIVAAKPSKTVSSSGSVPRSPCRQLTTSPAAGALPSAATRRLREAGHRLESSRTSSTVSASEAPHNMHLAQPPLPPHYPRGSLTGLADLHYTRESMLSDISDHLSTMSTLAHSADCNSSCGSPYEDRNGTINPFFRSDVGLEARRQQTPLGIEEDLFVYDDIIISKDEARTKHWRLAGRKPLLANMEPDKDSGASGAGNNFFSFNDFDVCVDEVDVMPMCAGSAEAVAALQQEALSETPNKRFKSMTVMITAAKQPNTVAHFLAQSRSKEPKANRPLRSFQASAHIGHATRVKCIALSPTEMDFASCSNEDASITLNNFGLGSEVGIFTGHQDTIINATFSPDGKYLATASKDKAMILWDVMTTKRLLTVAHPKVVICCCFSPDSKYLVSGCQDRVCRLWDTRRGREWLRYAEHKGIIIAIAFSPDGHYICSASADKSLRVWSATTAKTRFHLLGHAGMILSCSYTSDGRSIISNDELLLRVWSAEDGSCKLSVSPGDIAGSVRPSNRVPRVGWTLSSAAPGPFTRLMLVACSNRFVYILDIETGREVASVFCKAPVYCLAAGGYEKMACGDSFGNIYMLHLM